MERKRRKTKGKKKRGRRRRRRMKTHRKKVKVKAAISSARKWVTAFISKQLVGGVIPEPGERGRCLQSYLKATQKWHRLRDARRPARPHSTLFVFIYLFIRSFIYLFTQFSGRRLWR